MTTPTIRLHHFALSGHSHRALLFLSLLGLPVDVVLVDLARGAHKSPEFLAMNAFGQVPVLQDGDTTVADSNAILVYLAQRHDPTGHWLPQAPAQAAEVQRWLSAAAGLLAFGPAQARASHVFKRPLQPQAPELAQRLFSAMETTLSKQAFLASSQHPTIADIAMHTYTAHAPEGGLSLAPYPQVQRWLADIAALPGFVGMPPSSIPEPTTPQ